MEHLKQAPLVLLCLFGVKFLILNPTLNEVLTLLILTSVTAFIEYKNPNKKIKELEENFKKLAEVVGAHTDVVKEVRNNMSTIKMAQAYGSNKTGSTFGSK